MFNSANYNNDICECDISFTLQRVNETENVINFKN